MAPGAGASRASGKPDREAQGGRGESGGSRRAATPPASPSVPRRPAVRAGPLPGPAWPERSAEGRLRLGMLRGRARLRGCVVSPSYFHVPIFDIVLQFLCPAPC